MGQEKLSLYIFTTTFPYGKGETFLQSELTVLQKDFDQIFLIPLRTSGVARSIPEGVEVIDSSRFQANLTISDYFLILAILVSDLFQGRNKSFRYNFSLLKQNFIRAKKIVNFKADKKKSVFYSYWLSDWSVALAYAKKKKIIDVAISRTHRFDLYDEQHATGVQPFRKFTLNQLDRVYSVSDMGMEYLKEKFPNYKGIIKCSRLGVKQTDRVNQIPDKLHIVSVSNLIPVKRVHLIAEALSSSKINFLWTHFGSGNEEENIKAQTVKLGIDSKVDFKGWVPNDEVLEYLDKTDISVFVNVSESEGVPVSIMEAQARGIPVIATEVGGVPEIIPKTSGILLDKDFSIEMLSQYFKSLDDRSIQFSADRVKSNWKTKSSSIENYSDFSNQLKKLIQ